MKRRIHREDIVQAGLDLMFMNGYNATGIKDITDKIDIPKGSFYNHFNSKEAFGLEVVKSYCDGGVAMYEAYFLDTDLPPLKRFEIFFNQLIANYEDGDCKRGCIMSNFSTEMADVNERFRVLLDKEFNKCQSIMAACLEEARSNGDLSEVDDANALASYILNGWHGALVRMKSTGNVQPLEVFRDLTMKRLLS